MLTTALFVIVFTAVALGLVKLHDPAIQIYAATPVSEKLDRSVQKRLTLFIELMVALFFIATLASPARFSIIGSLIAAIGVVPCCIGYGRMIRAMHSTKIMDPLPWRRIVASYLMFASGIGVFALSYAT